MIKQFSQKNTKISFGKILLLSIGLLVVILLGYSYTKNFILNKEINEEINHIENEITNLQNQNVELTELIKYFDSSAYAEQKARAELSMKKEGENVVVISDENKSAESENQNLKSLALQDSNPKKWFKYFFIK
ncbi:septum formation initiator family protein [Patescibacteria group bacterium]|nr:septum formation initiator family protein [Patescibacteria group bacterium]